MLRGVGPMKSIEQFVLGIIDLFWLPIEQYRIDGRIVRGLQRGAHSFTTHTLLAALEITTRLMHLLQVCVWWTGGTRQYLQYQLIALFVQFTAETAYDIVSPGPSARRLAAAGRVHRMRSEAAAAVAAAAGVPYAYHGYNHRRGMPPPQDLREGVTNALAIVREGIGESAAIIRATASLEHDQKGAVGAVGAVIRQLPPTFVKPLVMITQASNNVLGGFRNQLLPDARRDAKQKWKDDDE